MKYIAQSSASTLVVAGMTRGRIAASAIGRILLDERMQQHGRVLRLDAGKMRHLVTARGACRRQHVSRLQLARRREQPPLANLPRDLVVTLAVAKRSGHATAARIE